MHTISTPAAHERYLNATLTTSSTPQHTTFLAVRSLTQEIRLCDFDPKLVTTAMTDKPSTARCGGRWTEAQILSSYTIGPPVPIHPAHLQCIALCGRLKYFIRFMKNCVVDVIGLRPGKRERERERERTVT